jgi:hypothetical protein
MGFECVYKYHDRLEEGGYDRDETKTFKKKVGDPFEDVSLTKLAAAVMAQLARRDVWIVDVEVFELSKKSISFKETKGGIILKNKKFLFDGGGEDESTIVIQEMIQHSPQPVYTAQPFNSPSQNHQNVNIQAHAEQPHPHNTNQAVHRRAIDYVIFSPELHHQVEIKQKGLRFTIDQKYPVYKKQQGVAGEIYTMVDDLGREQNISDKYFVAPPAGLLGDKELGFSESPSQREGGKLYWGNASGELDMPDIRRK